MKQKHDIELETNIF